MHLTNAYNISFRMCILYILYVNVIKYTARYIETRHTLCHKYGDVYSQATGLPENTTKCHQTTRLLSAVYPTRSLQLDNVM